MLAKIVNIFFKNFSRFISNREGKIDIHIVLFFIHLMLINASYVAFSFGGAAQALVKLTRAGLLGVGIVLLGMALKNVKLNRFLIVALAVFFLLNIPPIFFSFDKAKSIEQFILLFPFILYIGLFVLYMNYKNGSYWVKYKILSLIRIAFALPILSFLFGILTGNIEFQDHAGRSGIYGARIGFFASNQAAWSSLVFIAITLDFFYAGILSKWNKRLSFTLLFISAILIVFAAARVSMFGMFIFGVLFLMYNHRVTKVFKVGLVVAGFMVLIGSFLSISSQQRDQILTYIRIIDKGNYRTATSRGDRVSMAVGSMVKEPKSLIFGYGLGNYELAIEELYEKDTGNLHNSYIEILSNTGFVAGGFFLIFILGISTYKYFRYDVKTSSTFIAFLLLAGTENNFGAGQFIFIPWFTLMFLYMVLSVQDRNVRLNNIF